MSQRNFFEEMASKLKSKQKKKFFKCKIKVNIKNKWWRLVSYAQESQEMPDCKRALKDHEEFRFHPVVSGETRTGFKRKESYDHICT